MIEPHPRPKDRVAASRWAAEILKDRQRVVFLDTETTGLGSRDEVIQIAILDIEGHELCKTLLSMTKRKTIPRSASDVHGIKKKDLDGKPTYLELSPQLESVLRGKRIIAYNAEFDFRMMYQTFALAGGYEPDPAHWECAMKVYAAFHGERHPYFGDYKWQKLRGGHDAGDDTRKLLHLVKKMAAYYHGLQAEKRAQQEMRVIETHIAGLRVATVSIQLVSWLREFSYSVQETLEATGIPAYVFLWTGGVVLSFLPLLLFGSLYGTLAAFLGVAGLSAYFAFRNIDRKHELLQRDREKLEQTAADLKVKREALDAKKISIQK